MIDFFIVCLVRTVVRNREDRIRTCDILVPNQVLYQTELLPVQKDPFVKGGSNLYRILRINSVTRVLLCHSRNDDVYHKHERCLWSHDCPTLVYTGFEAEPHADIFVTPNWSHTINRLSRLPSLTLLFTGFRAVPVPVTEDKPLPKI